MQGNPLENLQNSIMLLVNDLLEQGRDTHFCMTPVNCQTSKDTQPLQDLTCGTKSHRKWVILSKQSRYTNLV